MNQANMSIRSLLVGLLSLFLTIAMDLVKAEDVGRSQVPLSIHLPDETATSLMPPGARDADDTVLASSADSGYAVAGTEKFNAPKYKDRLFTANSFHKYLGIGSIAAALITVAAPKEEDGLHEEMAKTSAALGLGALATGLIYHYEDLHLDAGLSDPDNLHALWAGLGALGIAAAAATGPDGPHSTFGSLGGIGMIIGVKYTW